MSSSAGRHTTDKMHGGKGTEVFVGGLPRSSIDDDTIRTVFSSCGEITEIRMIKDTKGISKGFCFVRFATKEAADTAVKEKTGTLIGGKKIGVLPSTEQNTLYFGKLNKDWSVEEFERMVHQIFPDVESIDLAILQDALPGQKRRNRGFGFVRFISHAAASRAQRVGSQPEFRLGNVHPSVEWAEEEPEIDPDELAKVKIAFVRNIPVEAEENYMKQLFEPFGKVEKVVISRKGSSSVGFVHFKDRLDLDRAVKEMNEKTIQGPNDGAIYKLQVEVARPADRNKKRARDNAENNHTVNRISKNLKKEPGATPSSSHIPLVRQEIATVVDPYEEAVIALPLAVKERLLRIFRLGIATRFDVDATSLCHLKELPEPISISVLDQLMLSGSSSQNKGAYLSALISKHLVDNKGLSQSSVDLSKYMDPTINESSRYSFSHRMSGHDAAARSDVYAPLYISSMADYALPSRTRVAVSEERPLEFVLPEQIPRTTRLEETSHSPFDTSTGHQSLQYPRVGLRTEEQHVPPFAAVPGSSLSYPRQGASSDHLLSRPRIRFDPFTGEPYKFDPFTGEPIEPESTSRRF